MAKPSLNELNLLGGWLCLDFANTADWSDQTCIREWLYSYVDLVHWSERAKILSDATVVRLQVQANERLEESQRVFERALQLRASLHRLFVAIAQNQAPQPTDLGYLNHEMAQLMPQLRVVQAPDRFVWGWSHHHEALDVMLSPIVWSAAQLLNTQEKLERVRHCPAEECGWLFIDTSRNRSRRWCDMKECGNRAKVNRFYQKKQNQNQ
jgi:predicted RNA-binding Zn ribbon-like protein